MTLSRRTLLKGAGSLSLATAAPALSTAARAANPHVVVVGGGFAGSTVAKYLALWSQGALDVTLVDPDPHHTSCVLSNLVLNEELQLSELQISHVYLKNKLGVNTLQARVTSISEGNRILTLDNGAELTYDRLVLAPGIAFEPIPGWDQERMPHAWIAGEGTESLRDQIKAMPADGTFLMTVPKSPYRCPPGPYERACLVAELVQEKGGRGKVIVLDANADIQAEKATFTKAFTGLYGSTIDYRTQQSVVSVDAAAMTVTTADNQTIPAHVINLIPNQRAPSLLTDAGLVPDGAKWASVDPISYESTIKPGIYIVGDAQGTAQPKSAHMGNAQAKVCADAILCALNGHDVRAASRVANITTNSACYSPITRNEASWLTANFYYDTSAGNMKLKHIGEAHSWTRDNYNEMFTWANNLFGDTFM